MADRKITELTALAAGSQATGDLLAIVDVSETAAANKNKKITVESLFKGIPGNVGIGTASPGAKLDVNGEVFFSPNTAGKNTHTFTTNASNDGRYLIKSDTTTKVDIQANGASFFNGGNVGIGTTSPNQALKVVKSSSGGTVIEFSDNVNATGRLGTPSSQVVSFGGNTNHSIAFGGYSTDGSTFSNERMRIDSSGRALIGTTGNSGAKLFVAGGSGQSAGTEVDIARFFASTAASTNSGGLTIGAVWHNTDVNQRIAYLQSEQGSNPGSTARRLALNPSGGNVGVGTSSPAAKFEVSDDAQSGVTAGDLIVDTTSLSADVTVGRQSSTSNDNTTFRVRDREDNTILYASASGDPFRVGRNGSEFGRFDTQGRLMIGRTTATHKFSLLGAANDRTAELQLTASGVASGYIGPNANGLNIGTDTAGIVFKTGVTGGGSVGGTGTERMRITSGGVVAVNRTTALHGGVFVLDYTNGTTAGLAIKDTRTTGIGVALHVVNGSGSVVGGISQNQSTTSFNTSSDYRLKENVVDIIDGIARVKQLQPRRFNFIADDSTTVDGFLAHEAQTVVPEAVTGTHNEVDDDGNAVMQGIDQSKLVPLLTAALQEAIAKIETLETKVAALEAG